MAAARGKVQTTALVLGLERRRSPRERAIIGEVNETVFALDFLETGGVASSKSCKKVGYSILFTDLAQLALRRLHFVIPDFRRPSGAETSEAALRTLFATFCEDSDDPTWRSQSS